MPPIRVLQLCAVDFTVKNFLRPLIRFLEAKDCEVVTACSRGRHFEELGREGFRMQEIEIRRSYDLLSHLNSIRRLTDYLRRERFDVVHVHTPIAALIGRIAATRAKVPVRFYTAHGFYFHDRMNPLVRRAHLELERYGGRCCDFIFTQSDEDRLTAIHEGIIAPDRIRTIGNGVDLTRFSRNAVNEEDRIRARKEFGLSKDDRVVAVIGRVVPEKGHGELFDAALQIRRTIPNLRLLVIGEALASDRGGGIGVFEQQVQALGDSVILAGMREDIPVLLSLAEVYTLPSWREGMPRSIIEAMAMGLPVVATDIRGCREEVVEGETGHLVPVKNAMRLSEALQDLLTNPAKARIMGEAGRKRAEQLYDERDVLERQWEIYQQFL